MNIIITGSTGMVGEGVLLECLENPNVKNVLMLNRKANWIKHPKLKELLVSDFTKLDAVANELKGYDACFFCAGVSSIGMNEADYTKFTYDTTIAVAKKLLELNPGMVFDYVSGTSTDSSEKGKMMWARVKGKTENDLMKMGFRKQFNFRPGIMKPIKGQKNLKTSYKILIPLTAPFFGKKVLTLKEVGMAMINSVTKEYPKQILEIADIRALAELK
jgi:uncharacterized protein YbjT (DUF2867 family)